MKARSDLSIASAYLVLFPLAVVLSVLAGYLAISAANALPTRSLGDWFVIAVNVLPAGLAGGVLYYGVARWLRAHPPAVTRHRRRALPLYLVATVLAGITVAGSWNDPGFGLVAQIFIWPAVAALGGILGDFLAWRPARVAPTV